MFFGPRMLAARFASIEFDGTGDYLSLPSNVALNPEGGDFTWEAWLNPDSWAATYSGIWVTAQTDGLWIGKNDTNFVVRRYGVTDVIQYPTMPTTAAQTHVAVTRASGTLRLFYAGVVVGSVADATSYATGVTYVADDGGGAYYNGKVSNLRFIKGTALYTAGFTPPTSPLTAVSGTQALICQGDFVDRSSNGFTVTVGGDAKPSIASPF